MNDFSEIENELKRLQPLSPSTEFLQRVENAMEEEVPAEEKIVRPHAFRIHWLSLGASLAAAALVLVFLRIDFHRSPAQPQIAAQLPGPGVEAPGNQAPTRSTNLPPTFIPAGATQVVYHTRDEGLHFSGGSEQPMRRVRSRTQETLQWQNPATGASLRVSYPTEQVQLIPVSGQ
jgi:hypothetical protein